MHASASNTKCILFTTDAEKADSTKQLSIGTASPRTFHNGMTGKDI
jgi:hypothetical protein